MQPHPDPVDPRALGDALFIAGVVHKDGDQLFGAGDVLIVCDVRPITMTQLRRLLERWEITPRWLLERLESLPADSAQDARWRETLDAVRWLAEGGADASA